MKTFSILERGPDIFCVLQRLKRSPGARGGGGGDSTLIRSVCVTGLLNSKERSYTQNDTRKQEQNMLEWREI